MGRLPPSWPVLRIDGSLRWGGRVRSEALRFAGRGARGRFALQLDLATPLRRRRYRDRRSLSRRRPWAGRPEHRLRADSTASFAGTARGLIRRVDNDALHGRREARSGSKAALPAKAAGCASRHAPRLAAVQLVGAGSVGPDGGLALRGQRAPVGARAAGDAPRRDRRAAADRASPGAPARSLGLSQVNSISNRRPALRLSRPRRVSARAVQRASTIAAQRRIGRSQCRFTQCSGAPRRACSARRGRSDRDPQLPRQPCGPARPRRDRARRPACRGASGRHRRAARRDPDRQRPLRCCARYRWGSAHRAASLRRRRGPAVGRGRHRWGAAERTAYAGSVDRRHDIAAGHRRQPAPQRRRPSQCVGPAIEVLCWQGCFNGWPAAELFSGRTEGCGRSGGSGEIGFGARSIAAASDPLSPRRPAMLARVTGPSAYLGDRAAARSCDLRLQFALLFGARRGGGKVGVLRATAELAAPLVAGMRVRCERSEVEGRGRRRVEHGLAGRRHVASRPFREATPVAAATPSSAARSRSSGEPAFEGETPPIRAHISPLTGRPTRRSGSRGASPQIGVRVARLPSRFSGPAAGP